MINAPVQYSELHCQVERLLGANRSPKLIGFDGAAGAGKSSAATWLAWQFGMPALHLDLYLVQQTAPAPIEWRVNELFNCIQSRGQRPLIVEGVLLLDAFEKLRRQVDYLVFVEKLPSSALTRDRNQDNDLTDRRECSLANQVSKYFERANPKGHADFTLSWQEL